MTLTGDGTAKSVYFLDIHGCPFVFGTDAIAPAAAWYTGRYYIGGEAQPPDSSYLKPYLAYTGIDIDETANFVDGTTDIQGMQLEIRDVGREVTAVIKSLLGGNKTILTTDHTDSATTITVDSTTGFASSGVIFIGQEAIYHTGKTATTFTTCTRGHFNSIPKPYDVDLTVLPIRTPAVRDGFWPLSGRRVDIYKGEVLADGTLETISGETTEVIFRGIIGSQAEIGEGNITISIESIFDKWNEPLGDRLFSGPLKKGYYYKSLLAGVGGGDDWSLSTIPVTVNDGGTVEVYYVSLDAGFYDAPVDLAREITEAAFAALTTPELDMRVHDLDGKWAIEWQFYGAASPESYELTWRVQKGDPLWALGFKEGDYAGEVTDGVRLESVSEEDPKAFVMELTWVAGDTTTPYCKVDDETQYTASTWVSFGGEDNQTLKIDNISTPGQIDFTADPRTGDPVNYNWKGYISLNDDADLYLNQVFAMYGDSLKEAMQRCLGLLGGQPEPNRWCVQGIESGDIDWTELDDWVADGGSPMGRMYYAITEPTTFQEVFCDRLGALAITPRMTDEAKIGFIKIQDPVELNAHTLELDSAVWEYFGSPHIKAALEGDQFLTQVEFNHSISWNGKSDSKPLRLHYDGSTSSLGRPHTKIYKLKGVWVDSTAYGLTSYDSPQDMLNSLADSILGTHITYHAGEAPIVGIPCVHKSKQYKIGDIVKITHDILPDVAEGSIGVTDRLGLVVHRTQHWNDQAADIIYVMLPASTLARPIAPCALATQWTQASKVLTFADTDLYAPTGISDLAEFVAGMDVAFTGFDDTNPSTDVGTIASVDAGAKTMTLTTDVFGANNNDSVWVTWKDYDSCNTTQQLWLFVGDTSYGLGAAPIFPCHTWGI